MKWFLHRILALAAAVLVVVGGLALLLRMQYTGETAERAVSEGGNAAWFGPAWTEDAEVAPAVAEAAPHLSAGQVEEVYVYVGTVDAEGGMAEARISGAEEVLARLGEVLPDVEVVAWLEHEPAGFGAAPFGEENRERIAAQAGELSAAGFAGVHHGLAGVGGNTPGLIPLLQEVRESLPEDSVLSAGVAGPEPLAGMGLPLGLLPADARYWSATRLGDVAEQVDRVVVRTGGSGLPLESLYGGLTARQTAVALDAVPEETGLLIGLPEAGENTAETVSAGVRGARLGLSEAGEPRPDFGLALHVHPDPARTAWAEYREGWIAPQEE